MELTIIKNNQDKKEKEEIKKNEKTKINIFFPEVIYPKEVEFIDELNEINKERYRKWLYKKTIAKKISEGSTFL